MNSNHRYASILFDTGADRSFVSTAFSSLINIAPSALDTKYDAELADGKIIRVDTIIWGCTLNLLYHPFNIDLMPVELGSFDVIIGTRTAKLCNDILMFQQHQGESLSKAWTHFKDFLQKVPHHGIDRWLLIQIFYDHVSFPLKCEIDHAAGSKLSDKNAVESLEIIKNLALYDHEGWNDSKDSIKPIKAIVVSPNASTTPDWQIFELEDQINFLLKGPQPTPKTSPIHIPQAYAKAVSSSSLPRDLNEPPRQNSFTFRDHELTASQTLKKLLIREEARHPITKNINSISLIRIEEEKNVENSRPIDKSIVEPNKSDKEEPPKGVDVKDKVERKADGEPAKSAMEDVTKKEEEEPARISSSHTIGY
ncbi:zinc finger, CCHC-type containing protein [Tanacetum coccineum]